MTRTPLSRSKGQRSRSPGSFTYRRVGASGGCSGGRENVLAVGNCCYVAVCSAAEGASAPTSGGEGRGHTVTATRLQLVVCSSAGMSVYLSVSVCLSVELCCVELTCIYTVPCLIFLSYFHCVRLLFLCVLSALLPDSNK